MGEYSIVAEERTGTGKGANRKLRATGRIPAIVYGRGFGVTSLDDPRPVTAETLFHMASVTKPFVATAIMQLVEEGLVALDDRVVMHLPYFAMVDERSGAITIRQMLSHTAGMPDEEDYGWDRPEYDDGALERYVRSVAERELIDAPGARFEYSNIAFEVLGDLLAKLRGTTFESVIAERILRPSPRSGASPCRRRAPRPGGARGCGSCAGRSPGSRWPCARARRC